MIAAVLLFATTVTYFWAVGAQRAWPRQRLGPAVRSCEEIQRTVSIDRELFGLCGAGHLRLLQISEAFSGDESSDPSQVT
jgi:hypothetical protein